MSLITSCPACGTMFRVVPDQLKISEGWVRCGHCGDVFDASAHLTDESSIELIRGIEPTRPVELQADGAGLATEPGDLPTRPADLPTQPADLPTQPADLPLPRAAAPTRPAATPPQAAASAARAPALPPRRPAPAPAPAPVAPAPAAAASEDSSSFFASDSQSLEPSPLDTPFVFRPSEFVPDRDPSVFPPAPGRESQLEEDDDDFPPPLANVSFVRQARRKAFWRRPTVRLLLALFALALAALLALQVAYQDRNRLALAEPALRPALERMCAELQCTLGAPRQIESISIESSGFNRVRNDTYRLSFALRNTARVQVAMPSMELTVTDAQDQPIARRVLTPAELGARDDALAAGADWSGAIGLAIDAGTAGRVAGYRLLAFYP